MIVYRVCFKHNRLYHPQRGDWELRIHDLPPHHRLHLEAARCDLCTAECPDTRREDREHLAPSRPPRQ